MTAEIITLQPKEKPANANCPLVSMMLYRNVNGMTVITNLANLSKEEFLQALINDALMQEKQALVGNLIESTN